MKSVRFIGKYKDLTPQYGYEFHKLYADDQETYSKRVMPHSGNAVWVCVANNEVEWANFYNLSYLVFDVAKGLVIPEGLRFVRFVIGEKNETIDKVDMGMTHKGLAEYGRTLDGYKTIILGEKELKLINELWENDLIEIVENEKKEDKDER